MPNLDKPLAERLYESRMRYVNPNYHEPDDFSPFVNRVAAWSIRFVVCAAVIVMAVNIVHWMVVR